MVIFGDLDGLQMKYEASGNSIHVWKAIKYLSTHDTPYPQWVNNYLSQTANALLSIKTKGKGQYRRIDQKGFYRRIAHVIGIKQLDISKEIKSNRDAEIFIFIQNKSREHNLSECFKLAHENFKLSEETIENIYKKIRSFENKLYRENSRGG